MAVQVVAERYRILGKAGEGAISTVYRAHDAVLDRDVALKVLKSGPGIDANAAQRFDVEARAAARIVDPHVAAIYDVIDTKLGRSIVMEFVDGPSLSERLKVCGALSEPTVIAYAKQIAQALSAAHAQGILHRDIKPGNILLTKDERIKVVDFGLVKAFDGTSATLTQSGMFVGSVHYVSPEQAQGKPLTAASDLYSLGVLMYQMQTGSLPFAGGESPLAIALAHVTKPAPSQRKLEQSMSQGLAAIVSKPLQKDPQARYASATAVSAALDELQQKEASAASTQALDAPTMTSPVVSSALLSSRGIEGPRALRPGSGQAPSTGQRVALLKLSAGAAVFATWFVTTRKRVEAKLRVYDYSRLQTAPVIFAALFIAIVIIIAAFAKPVPKTAARAHAKPSPRAAAATVAVPNLIGLPLATARIRLHQMGLQGQYGAVYSNATAGTIVRQAPSPGTPVQRNTTMMVVIAVPAPSDGGD